MKKMEISAAVRPYFLKERRNRNCNIEKLFEDTKPVKNVSSKGARKSLPTKKAKLVNPHNPTRYERERATMRNKPRKVLNLEERILAIRLYQNKPVYQRVASVFKCSFEQIRNVIANRDDILRYYGDCQTVTHSDTPELARNKKINFLGNVAYEFVRRAHYHHSVTLNDAALRARALKLRDILQIEQFYPNKVWLADFKKVYNVEWQNLDALIICGVPPHSLDNKDLIEHCTRMVAKAKALIGKVPKSQSKKESDKLYEEDDTNEEWYGGSGGDGDGIEDSLDDKRSDTVSAELNDDVPVVNEVDDYAGMYLDTADNDAEDFNGCESARNAAGTALHITTEPTLLSEEVQIKQERRSRSRSRSRSPPLLLPLLPVTNGASTRSNNAAGGVGGVVKREHSATTTPKGADAVEPHGKRFKSDTVDTYADALRNLCALEDFATQQEDFEAINLLVQLERVLEKGAKSNTARKRMFNA